MKTFNDLSMFKKLILSFALIVLILAGEAIVSLYQLKTMGQLSSGFYNDSLLPIERINVNIKNNTVLFPLKSVAAVIGIGPGYDATQVGSTCDVCSKRDTCQMRQDD